MRFQGLGAFAFFLLGAFYSGGCAKTSHDSTGIFFSCESDPSPPRLGSNTFTIMLTGMDGTRLRGAYISLEGDMSHPGMSPVFGEAKETAPGRYQGTLDFDMRGDWTVLFHIKLTSGQTFERQVKIQNVRAA
jgi:hypothetical protein